VRPLARRALPGLLVALAGCPAPAPTANPPSLWLSFSQREINIVLVDHEPPPF
jgi:hypothetical protein